VLPRRYLLSHIAGRGVGAPCIRAGSWHGRRALGCSEFRVPTPIFGHKLNATVIYVTRAYELARAIRLGHAS